MDAKKLWEALESNFWDMKQLIASLRKKKLKQEQRRKTEQFTEEEKKEMKSGWQRHSRNVFTNKFLTQLMGGPPWDAVILLERSWIWTLALCPKTNARSRSIRGT